MPPNNALQPTLRRICKKAAGLLRAAELCSLGGYMRTKILMLLLPLSISACAFQEHLPEQPSQATAQIQRWVPIGTLEADARRIMEKHQFTCAMITNGEFGQLRGVDYLYCDYRYSGIVHRRWQAALILVSGKVSVVYVTTGLIGP